MSRRKRKHTCKNHPAVIARGRCSQCGAWICTNCSRLTNGQLFCELTCLPNKEVKTQEKKECKEEKQFLSRNTSDKKKYTQIAINIVSLLIGLSGCLFGIYQHELRRSSQIECTSLRRQISDLNQKRANIQTSLDRKRMQIAQTDSLRDKEKLSVDSSYSVSQTDIPAPVLPKEIVQSLPLSVVNGTTRKKIISLTFDGGSYDNAAEQILDTLQSRGVKATMFLTGQFMRRHPHTVVEIVERGHEIGNHTWSHPHLTTWAENRRHHTLSGVNRATIGSQLKKANDQFRKITGSNLAPIWRAPFGEKNRDICSWALSHGYVHIAWKQGRTWLEGYDSNDWVPDEDTPGYHSPQEVYEKFMNLATQDTDGMNGGILLFHLGTSRKDPEKQVHRILGSLIDGFHAAGYQIVPVTVLLEESGVDLKPLTESTIFVRN